MAEISPPAITTREAKKDVAGLDVFQSRSSAPLSPEPNPPFVFPMPAEGSSSPGKNTGPSLKAGSSPSGPGFARRRPEQIEIASLPAFSFPSPLTTPTRDSPQSSPSRAIPISRSGGGHRRGGSEFIGGDGSTLGPGLMSSSPTKGESALPPPSMAGRRRGHAHRRSGAISQHDLSNILGPSDPNSRKIGSAPTTPSDPEVHKQFIPSLDRASSQPALPHTTPEVEASPKLPEATEAPETASPPVPPARPRVGFSDRLEYIPRPLSTISSATASSVSTVRPSHSLNGSISSIRSNNTPSPPTTRTHGRGLFGGELHSNIEELASSVTNEPGTFRIPARTPYRYSPPPPDLADLTEDESSFSPDVLDLDSVLPPFAFDRHNEEIVSGTSSEASMDPTSEVVPDPKTMTTRLDSALEVKNDRRQSRGKSWTGLLSRKRNPSGFVDNVEEVNSTAPAQDSPTARSPEPNAIENLSLDDVNFDEDTTFVLRSPQYDVPRSAPVNPNSSWRSGSSSESESGDVLDLDAAWDLAGNEIKSRMGGIGLRTSQRRLHSSGLTGGFVGPGMHYHRRAESAPVMTPVDYQFGFPRFGSNPQMADVFEEEEDEENRKSQTSNEPSRSKSIKNELEAQGSGVQATDLAFATPLSSLRLSKEPKSKHVSTVATQPAETAPSPPVTTDKAQEASLDLSIDIVDAVDEPRFSVVTKSSDESTITPTLSNDPLRSRPVPASLDFAPPRAEQFSGYSSLNPSPSPAKTSFDVPRLGTAHSSTTERSGWSSARTGEVGTEVGYSTEDVPSLTSSASTMISHPVPYTPVVGSRPDADRSHSLSEAVPERPTTSNSAFKRRSLASLSMLRLGSSSSKSKLSIETRPGQEGSEGGERTKKKRHRISRIMKFWNKSNDDLKG